MALKDDILTMLRLFAHKQSSAQIHYAEFCEYMRRYAQHHIADKPQLVPFLSNPDGAIAKDIATLEHEKKLIILNPNSEKKAIIVVAYFSERYANQYREMENSPAIPYPMLTDLPKQTPSSIVEKKNASEFIADLFEIEEGLEKEKAISTESGVKLETKKINTDLLYALVLPRELPPVLLPATIKASSIMNIALSKIRQMLRKEEWHDYFLKKLKISNPGKEMSVKNFFTQFVQRPTETLESLKKSGDTYYYLSQLSYFIKKDYEKVKDYTAEDLSVLQSICISEIATGYYKNRAQQNLIKTSAFENLESQLNKPPYYFTHSSIEKFRDSKGTQLIGQYSEKELSTYLKQKTTALESSNLPPLLTFKVVKGQHYYIQKNNVLPLVVRLSSDVRETIKDTITKEWFDMYKIFQSELAMKDQDAFEERLGNDIKTYSPILYALLNSNFISLIHYENRVSNNIAGTSVTLFRDGKLIPYSELLMLSRHELTTDARIMLPFWYTVPVISWIAKFIFGPSKKKEKKQKEAKKEQKQTAFVELQDIDDSSKKRNSKRTELRKAARDLEEEMVTPGSTLIRDLKSYEHEWNKLIGGETRDNLTEDVNSLIRDYMRKTLRALQGSSFTKARIENLAKTLVESSSLKKIKNKESLQMYIELYMIKLVKNV